MKEILARHKELSAQVDRWFARSLELYPDRISCKSGCSACCRSTFDITLLDAYVLKLGFDALPAPARELVLVKCRERLRMMRRRWPEFEHPFVLNYRPEEEWEALMPEEDETPCVLLGEDGRCLVYEHRPMTCRLHGIPQVDDCGECLDEEWCTLNFVGTDPLQLEGLRAPLNEMLAREVALILDANGAILGQRLSQVDTLIPTALLIDFERFDWREWARGFNLLRRGSF